MRQMQLLRSLDHILQATFVFIRSYFTLSPGSGCFPQSYWLPDPTDGCWIRKLLHQRGDVDPHQRVPVPRWGDEKDCAQGEGRWTPVLLYSANWIFSVQPSLLGPCFCSPYVNDLRLSLTPVQLHGLSESSVLHKRKHAISRADIYVLFHRWWNSVAAQMV